MVVIIEGLDATGKSTLGRLIASEYNMPVQESEGPPRSTSEFLDRLDRYATLKNIVFVRHPLVSNRIYDIGRDPSKIVEVPMAYYNQFYSQPNIFIYCDKPRFKVDHEVKEHDTPEHLAMIEAKRNALLIEYRKWALKHAHALYRIGDDPRFILNMVKGSL